MRHLYGKLGAHHRAEAVERARALELGYNELPLFDPRQAAVADRITLGRFTKQEDVDFAADLIKRKVAKLRELSPLWEMYKDGVDLNSVQWAAH